MPILRVKDDKGNIIPIPAIKGDKGDKGDRGDSGVYVGSGAIPNGCNVKIDPNGEADDVVTRAEFEELNKNLTDLIKHKTLTITPDVIGNMYLQITGIPLHISVASMEGKVILYRFATYNGLPYVRLYDGDDNVITTQVTFDLYYLEL